MSKKDDYEFKPQHKGAKLALKIILLLVCLAVSFVVGLKVCDKLSNKSVTTTKSNNEEVKSDTTTTNDEKDNDDNTSVESNSEATNSDDEEGTIIDEADLIDLEDVYYDIHVRVNSIIIAEDDQIWETAAITNDFLNNTIDQLKGRDDYLYNELVKWRDLDFSNAVEVHNYVWEKLGGTVGKATGLNEEAIAELKENLAGYTYQ